jgi:hypothetical protein
MFEHNWLSSTTCPSGRIPWHDIILAVLVREGELTMSQYTELKAAIDAINKRRTYIANYEQLVGAVAKALAGAHALGAVGRKTSFNSLINMVRGDLQAALNLIDNTRYGMRAEADRGEYGLS